MGDHAISGPRRSPMVDDSNTLPDPYPYRARVWWRDEVVADSRATRRVDRPDDAPQLWFPRDDVRDDASTDDGICRAADGALGGFVVFDADRARVEIVDGRDGDDERDVTTKRFPTWGDAS